ncbi:unnamed protein product, partial [Ixodes hexagonus]
VQCDKPDDPLNGRAIYTELLFNSLVKYECRHGFRIKGPPTARCNSQRQWEGAPTHCVEIDCGHPGHLHNGYVEFRTSTLNAKASYNCFDGMKFQGQANSSVCLDTGNWSNPLPKCLGENIETNIERGRLPHPLSVSSRLDHAYKVGVPGCDRNHQRASRPDRLTCVFGQPLTRPGGVCRSRLCAARCKSLPERPAHGIVIAPKTEHGMRALFHCVDGYELVGPNVTVCQFGNWTHKTVPVCREIYCPFPGSIEHGRVLLVGNMGMYDYRPYVRRVSNNRQIMFECARGYTILRGPPGATCVDGSWSPAELPRCVRGSHPHVRQIRSSHARRRRRRHGDAGRRRRRWRRNWGEAQGTPVLIRSVYDLSHQREVRPCRLEAGMRLVAGNASGESATEALPGSEARLSCPGGNRTARCVLGAWRPTSCLCRPLTCSLPLVGHGSFRELTTERPLLADESVGHGTLVELFCDSGYQVQGQPELRCWQGGWGPAPFPQCLPEPCELPTLSEGRYLGGYRAGLTISPGSSVEYDCDDGFAPLTPPLLRCQEGRLRPDKPGCSAAAGAPTFDRGDGAVPPSGASAAASSASDRACSAPERLHNALAYRSPPQDEEGDVQGLLQFPHGTEVVFRCIDGAGGERSTWKLLCEDGSWLGRPEKCEEVDPRLSVPREERRNRSCVFRNAEPNLEAFLGDRRVTEDAVHLPPGTELVFRCKDIGKYSLIGSTRRRCVYGDWDGIKPSCFGLSQENDYALEKPPTILFRPHVTPVAQSNDGKLIVYPGAILHLECLWLRKYGTPKWEVSHKSRKYAEGWTTEPGRDSQLEYRLSIYHAKKDDTGRYTCVTPMGHKHSVDIVVARERSCAFFDVSTRGPPLLSSVSPAFSSPPGLLVSTTNTRMGTKVVFSCEEGKRIQGSQQSTCLPSGNWSSVTPYCQVAECQDISDSPDSLVVVKSQDKVVGSRAYFSCPPGYGLRGQAHVECLDTGLWSGPLPSCQ